MSSIIYNTDVKRFSIVETRSFANNNLPKIVQKDWKRLTSQQQNDYLSLQTFQACKQWAQNHNVQLQNSNGGGSSSGQQKGNNNISNNNNNNNSKNNNKSTDIGKIHTGNHWSKNSPKIYAYEKLLTKNLDQLKFDNRVVGYERMDDCYAVELPDDVWIQIYPTADGTYVITKLDMGDGGYLTSSRRFNAIVAGPKELRNIISNLKRLEEPGLIRSLILKGVGFITGTDLVDKIKFKLW